MSSFIRSLDSAISTPAGLCSTYRMFFFTLSGPIQVSVERQQCPKWTIISFAFAWLAVTSSMQHSPYELKSRLSQYENELTCLRERKRGRQCGLWCSVRPLVPCRLQGLAQAQRLGTIVRRSLPLLLWLPRRHHRGRIAPVCLCLLLTIPFWFKIWF